MSTKSDENQQTTRQRILLEATKEFAEKGYEGARVDSIVNRSNVSKNLVYHYFKSKENLFLDVLGAEYEKMRRGHEGWPDKTLGPESNIRGLVKLVFLHWQNSSHFIRLLASENFSEGRHIRKLSGLREGYEVWINKITQVLDDGVNQGVFRTGINPTELYISISALVYHRMSNRFTLSFLLDRNYEKQDTLDACYAHIERMVLNDILRVTAPDGGADTS